MVAKSADAVSGISKPGRRDLSRGPSGSDKALLAGCDVSQVRPRARGRERWAFRCDPPVRRPSEEKRDGDGDDGIQLQGPVQVDPGDQVPGVPQRDDWLEGGPDRALHVLRSENDADMRVVDGVRGRGPLGPINLRSLDWAARVRGKSG